MDLAWWLSSGPHSRVVALLLMLALMSIAALLSIEQRRIHPEERL